MGKLLMEPNTLWSTQPKFWVSQPFGPPHSAPIEDGHVLRLVLPWCEIRYTSERSWRSRKHSRLV